MIRSRAGRNRSFCRSSRGFDIASPEQSPLDQGITIRLKSESQIARNPSPIPPFLQNRLLAQAGLSLCPSDIQILHGRLIRVTQKWQRASTHSSLELRPHAAMRLILAAFNDKVLRAPAQHAARKVSNPLDA